MATQLFEGKDHAALYQKYRFAPQETVPKVIFSYLEKKGLKSFQLAADVGCGTGQGTHFLAKRFEKVVATDISQAQIEEATQAPHPPNISYQVCPAEKLPFQDSSVDFVMSLTAVHWFDLPPFMQEVDRILKPSGCVAFSSCTLDVQIHYKDCTEKLTEIFQETLLGSATLLQGQLTAVANCLFSFNGAAGQIVGTDSCPGKRNAEPRRVSQKLEVTSQEEKTIEKTIEIHKPLLPYRSEKVKHVLDDYKFIFDSLPFQDKERITDIVEKVPMTIAQMMGYIQSISMYQEFLKDHPEEARFLIENTEKRFLEVMGVSSHETLVELGMRYVCVLGCKNS